MNENQPEIFVPDNTAAQASSNREMTEAATAIAMAKKFPRNLNDVETELVQECQVYGLAEVSMYNFEKGGKVEGPSIRLAEALIRAYGNADYGFRELGRTSEKSEIEAFAWDKQKNVRVSRKFTVDFKLKLKNGNMKILTDPRDQREHVASMAQRVVRAAILEVVPGHLVNRAVEECKKTLLAGPKNMSLQQRIGKMSSEFAKIGVDRKMLEKYLGHSLDNATAEDVVELGKEYNSIRDGFKSIKDIFDPKEEKTTKSDLNDVLKAKEGQVEDAGTN